MRWTNALLLCGTLGALLVACGSDDARVPPLGPATFADASLAPRTDAAADVLLADASDAGCATCTGASLPTWKLGDYQPLSPGYGKTYGLEAFKGKVTVVALLASW